jgi:TPR repeat protein
MTEPMLRASHGNDDKQQKHGLFGLIRRLYSEDSLWRGALDVMIIGGVVMALAGPQIPWSSLKNFVPSWLSDKFTPGPSASYTPPSQPSTPATPATPAVTAVVDPELAKLRSLAASGDVVTQFKLAQALNFGHGFTVDKGEAAEWYRRAADQGHIEAMTVLAAMLYQGDGIAADQAQARNWSEKAAELGGRSAQLGLAEMLEHGKGGAADIEGALYWYAKAAEAGEKKAQARLGQLLLEFPEPDYFRAAFWLAVAKAAGEDTEKKLQAALGALSNSRAEIVTTAAGEWRVGKSEPSRALAQSAADPKRIPLVDLAVSSKQFEEAAELIRPLVAAGDPTAMFLWGRMLKLGIGVAKDTSEAQEWFRRSAAKKYPKAQIELIKSRPKTDEDRNIATTVLAEAVLSGDLTVRVNYAIHQASEPNLSQTKAVEVMHRLLELEDAGDRDIYHHLADLTRRGLGTKSDPVKAFEWELLAADDGIAAAQYAVGLAYRDGYGTSRDLTRATMWLTLAGRTLPEAKGDLNELKSVATDSETKAGKNAASTWRPGMHSWAKHLRAMPEDIREEFVLGSKAFISGDHEIGWRMIPPIAEAGWAVAQDFLGDMLLTGLGRPKNPEEALNWYRKAARQGHYAAIGSLGAFYLKGQVVAKDLEMAHRLLLHSAIKNQPQAAYELSMLYLDRNYSLKSDLAAYVWLSIAAEKKEEAKETLPVVRNRLSKADLALAEKAIGWLKDLFAGNAPQKDSASAPSQADLQKRFQAAVDLFDKKEYQKSLALLEELATANHLSSQASLALIYYGGQEIAKDHARALHWARKAAAQSNPQGLTVLANLYKEGIVVKKDVAEAVNYLSKAADLGNHEAARQLAMHYEGGNGVPRDYVKAFELNKIAAKSKPSAAANLGRAYRLGRGVEKNYAEAAHWYRKAAEGGSLVGLYELGMFYRSGIGVDKRDTAQAANFISQAAQAGHAEAQFALGEMYLDGEGVIADPVEAYVWLRLADEAGVAGAENKLNTAKSLINPSQIASADRRARDLAAKKK